MLYRWIWDHYCSKNAVSQRPSDHSPELVIWCPLPIRVCDAFLVVYAVNSYDSFSYAKIFLDKIMRMRNGEVIFHLLGNKDDLGFTGSREVKDKDGVAYAKACNGTFCHISARESKYEYVEQSFTHLIKRLQQSRASSQAATIDAEGSVSALVPPKLGARKKSLIQLVTRLLK